MSVVEADADVVKVILISAMLASGQPLKPMTPIRTPKFDLHARLRYRTYGYLREKWKRRRRGLILRVGLS
jgi:hypothetical protein